MVFITLALPNWNKENPVRHSRLKQQWCFARQRPLSLLLQLLVTVWLCVMSLLAQANFTIEYAQTRLVDDVYHLDATLDYDLSSASIEAVNNGVTLTFVLNIKVEHERWYLWDAELAVLTQRYQLKYRALSDQYEVHYLNTGVKVQFPTLQDALETLGRVVDFPLIDLHFIKPNNVYWVYLRMHLDIEALPAPMRTTAYFMPAWRLISDWYVCPLEPPKL